MSSFAGLADYLRALAHLGPLDERSRSAVARLVGLAPAAEEESHEPAPASVCIPDAVAPLHSAPPQPVARSGHAALRGDEIESEIRHLSDTLPPVPVWLRRETQLPAQAGDDPLGGSGAPDPLLAPAQTRSILAAGLATTAYDGELWVEEAVRWIASGRPFVDVPRMPRPTLLRGVQVLVDCGAGMLPFHEDVEQLLDRVRSVVGRTLARVLQFEGSPLRGAGEDGRWSWTDYESQCPAPGTVVLVVTDLGISPAETSASVGEWRTFANLVHRNGCPLRALVPYEEHRWPRGLKRELTILPWDRSNGVHRVARALARERSRRRGDAP